MAKVEVEITPATLVLKPGTNEQIARKQMSKAQAQAAAGIDGDGKPLFGKAGQRLDLYESGDLWKKFSVVEADGEATLVLVDHARYVFRELGGKYKSLTLSQPYQAQLAVELEPLLTQNAFIKEDGQ